MTRQSSSSLRLVYQVRCLNDATSPRKSFVVLTHLAVLRSGGNSMVRHVVLRNTRHPQARFIHDIPRLSSRRHCNGHLLLVKILYSVLTCPVPPSRHTPVTSAIKTKRLTSDLALESGSSRIEYFSLRLPTQHRPIHRSNGPTHLMYIPTRSSLYTLRCT